MLSFHAEFVFAAGLLELLDHSSSFWRKSPFPARFLTGVSKRLADELARSKERGENERGWRRDCINHSSAELFRHVYALVVPSAAAASEEEGGKVGAAAANSGAPYAE